MSKIQKTYGWLNTRPNSAKALVNQAKREVPGFAEHMKKFEQHCTRLWITTSGQPMVY